MILGKYRSFVVKKCEILLSEGAMSRSKAKRSYCLSHFGRGLKVNRKAVALLLGGVGDPPTKEARSTKLDPPLHANIIKL